MNSSSSINKYNVGSTFTGESLAGVQTGSDVNFSTVTASAISTSSISATSAAIITLTGTTASFDSAAIDELIIESLEVTATTQSTDKDTGAVIVQGGQGIEKNLNVGGTVGVVGRLTVADTTASVSKDTGCAVFEGGVGLDGNLNVGGDIEALSEIRTPLIVATTGDITGNLDVGGDVDITGTLTTADIAFTDLVVSGTATVGDTTEASSTTTGALQVAGGASFVKKVYSGGGYNGNSLGSFAGNNLSLTNGAGTAAFGFSGNDITHSGGFNNPLIINNTTQSTDKDTGALIVQGGVGCEKNFYAGGKVTSNDDMGSANGYWTGSTVFAGDRLQFITAPVFSVYNGSGIGVELSTGNTSWAAGSDRALKKNIKPLEYGLKEIEQLKPSRFNYKVDKKNDSKRLGFIAQEVKPLLPELVNGEEGKHSLSMTDMIPVMVKAIQELSQSIAELKKKRPVEEEEEEEVKPKAKAKRARKE